MLQSFRASALLLCLSLLTASVRAIPQVTRTGRYLYTQDGNRFYIKGIAYQEQGAVVASADNPFLEPSGFIDPLAEDSACARDLPNLQSLGVNVIRVYSVNSSLNHDACMNAFSAAGIYAIIDLALPLNGSIDRTTPSWGTNLLEQYTQTIDTFSKYDNVLAYNVGNEVIVQNNTQVAPFVKAAARDIKSYLTSKGSSALVSYAAIDGPSDFTVPLANFFSCDVTNSNSGGNAIDMFGLNNYEWCGASTFETSYAGVEGDFAGFNVVAYFSEFGCITSPPRLWTEAVALLSSQMSPVWSGGIAFSYFPATSAQGQFGMVNISADGSSVTTSDDFTRLQQQYALAAPPNSPAMSGAPASSYPSCPSANTTLLASSNIPPTPDSAACDCLESSLSCQFTPATTNYSAIVGELLDTGCSLLGQAGGSCNDIGGNGQTGVYGRVADCDPTIKLSYVMSQFFEINNRNPQSCSFAGNGTVNPHASTSTSAAVAAASSCISNPSATFTPSATPASGNSGSNGSGGSTASGSSKTGTTTKNGAVSLVDGGVVMGLGAMAFVGVASAFFTLS